MTAIKSKLSLGSDAWSSNKRYKVGDLVTYNNLKYQNLTGINSEPGTSLDWFLNFSNNQSGTQNHSQLNLDDGTNPHGTTKTDVGLGNVPDIDFTNIKIDSVSGDAVDNTDPLNPVINYESAAQIKTKYESNANTNPFTDSEQSKLAGLESSKFVGEFVSLSALQTAFPTAPVGSYAYVDTGVGQPVEKYIWDNNDSQWELQQGQSTAETPATIKQKYETNANTNAFTDTEKSNLANQSNTNTGDETTSTIQNKRPLKTLDGQTLDGAGDIPIMLKNIYDTNDDGIVDKAQNVIYKAELNQSAVKGNLVYAVGRNPITGSPIIGLADNTVSFADKTVGMALESGPAGSVIEVVKIGVIEDIDTSLFSVGETIYLSTFGTFDKKSNITTGVFNPVGFVVKSDFSEGAIIIDTTATESIDTDNTINKSDIDGRTASDALNNLRRFYDRDIPGLYLAGQTTVALANQQNNVYEQYGEGLTFLCPKTDNYRLGVVWVWSSNVGNQSMDFKISVILDGGTPIQLITTKYENKELGGAGVVVNVIENGAIQGNTNTGTDTRLPQTVWADFVLAEGVEYKWILEFLAEGGVPAALTIYNAQISIEQKTIKIS